MVQLRQEAGYTNREAFLRALKGAGAIVSPGRMGRIERGQSMPDVDEIAAICDTLNTTADYWLLGLPDYHDQLAAMLHPLTHSKRDFLIKMAEELARV